MESRSGRARGDLQELGDLHERQPEVVVQDEDGTLVDRNPREGPLELVAVGDEPRVIGGNTVYVLRVVGGGAVLDLTSTSDLEASRALQARVRAAIEGRAE